MAIEIAQQHLTIGDLSKQPGNIPTGVWELRALSIKAKDVTKTSRDGDEYETTEYVVALEPVKPTASVDPAAVAELDPMTGKPVYDGKRLFLRYTAAFQNERAQLGAMLSAMGFGEKDKFAEVIEGNLVKGKKVYGEIFNRTFTRNDGTPGTDQRVKSWSSVAAADALAI